MSKYKVFNKQKTQPKSLLYSGNVPYTIKLTRQRVIVALIAGFRMEAYFSVIKTLNLTYDLHKILFFMVNCSIRDSSGVRDGYWKIFALQKASFHYSCYSAYLFFLSWLFCRRIFFFFFWYERQDLHSLNSGYWEGALYRAPKKKNIRQSPIICASSSE